ncbi:AMP-dependent synthetase/ligase [Anaeromyxobacter oryzae]|uniref:AMP-dependent synthetase n=1 Tax=Anaeromyxobacter oryzae TaxID=2918170 RepID=A0ABM7WU93_9BACT|nr:AMP-dependent synthetase/ligase [Anaeromyxobacter oryzae]BDG03061.1 AMP-dependent synthetase [Anaeromyxobacter oryzae]
MIGPEPGSVPRPVAPAARPGGPQGAKQAAAARGVAAEARSLPALLEARAAASGAEVAAFHRLAGEWRTVTWSEIAARVRDLAAGLGALGLERGDRVAVISDTTLDGVVADLGILAAGAVSVPIYPSTTAAECRDLLGRTGARLALCDRDEHAAKLAEIRGALPALEGVVRLAPRAGSGERTVAQVEAIGRAARQAEPRRNIERAAALAPDDLACLLFTSGTTGTPKGVMLTHGNWLYAAAKAEDVAVMRGDDLALVFLPLAHAFGKLCEYAWVHVGGRIALTGTMDRIADDAAEVRPTYIPGPPRVYEKIFAGVVSKGVAAPGLQGRLFRTALAAFDAWAAAAERGEPYRSLGLVLARRVVLPRVGRMVQARLGGRLRLLLSGSAPLSPRISRFYEAIGVPIVQGYGMTEASAASCVNRPGEVRHGTVGPPVPGTEVRIADDGEVLLRSPGVMRGYWEDPTATAEVLEPDGWLHTGDIGTLEPDGSLRITDRKKDLIVTAGGKKIAPQQLERELKGDPLVSQVVVHGDRRKFVTALVSLDDAAVRRWAAERGIALGPVPGESPEVRRRIQETVDAVNAQLPRYATIKRFAILPRDLGVADGELTATLKVRRKACEARYAAVLDALYAEDESADGGG